MVLVLAYGTEYTYGAHDYPTSGVFEVKPRQCPGFQFRRSIIVGTIWIDVRTLQNFIEELACEYTGESYNLIYKNCNHFCNDVCMRLVGVPLPSWVNRLAKLGKCWCGNPDLSRESFTTAINGLLLLGSMCFAAFLVWDMKMPRSR